MIENKMKALVAVAGLAFCAAGFVGLAGLIAYAIADDSAGHSADDATKHRIARA